MQIDTQLTYRLGQTFEISPHYTGAFVDLPSGSTSIHVGILDFNVNFTPDMQLKTEAQYDNISKQFTFSARYRWEFQPGSEFFVALGENASITERLFDPQYASQTTQAPIRIGPTLRF